MWYHAGGLQRNSSLGFRKLRLSAHTFSVHSGNQKVSCEMFLYALHKTSHSDMQPLTTSCSDFFTVAVEWANR